MGHVARIRERRNMSSILASEPQVKRPTERRSHRWACNIRMRLKNRMDLSRLWGDNWWADVETAMNVKIF